MHRGFSVVIEFGDADIADIAIERRTHDLNMHDFARHGDLERLGLLGADDRQRDLGARIASHFGNSLIERHPFERLAIDLGDVVTGLEPAREAGVPSIGETTRIWPFCCWT